MLKRHGTRLDIGTAEDVAELNAAEALLRASYKPAPMGFTSTVGSSSGSGGGHMNTTAMVDLGGAYGAASTARPAGGGGSGGGGMAGTAPSYSLPGALTRPHGDSGGSGFMQPSSSSATATPTSAYAAPHVHLGHPSAAAGAGFAPTPASPSAVSVHAQRALYRSGDTASPPSRGSVGTDYTASAGPTPGGNSSSSRATGVGPGGRRVTAQPLFHSPHSSSGAGVEAEEDGEEREEEMRGRPSMMRAHFAVPVPASSTAGSVPAVGGGGGPRGVAGVPAGSAYSRRGAASSAAVPLPMPTRLHHPVDVDVDDDEEEDVPARPSRVSGRYQLPRSPRHGDPADF